LKRRLGASIMAKCSALIPTSFAMPEITLSLFAPSARRISHLARTTFIVSAPMGQQDIDRIARNAASRVEEKIGQDQFIRLLLSLTLKLVKFAMLINRFQNFMRMVVFRTAQKNIAADARLAFLRELNKNSQKFTCQNHKEGLQVPKILFPASSIMQQSVNNILGLTLILFIFLSYTRSREGFALYRGLK